MTTRMVLKTSNRLRRHRTQVKRVRSFDRGYWQDDYAYNSGNGCFYSTYNNEIGHTSSDSFTDDNYDYTANWNWNINDGATVNVNDHVTGSACGATTDSWHCAWEYSNGCVGNVGYDDVTPIPSVDYDETISHAVSGDDTDAAIEALTTKRLEGLANLGKKAKFTLNTVNSCTFLGSGFELLKGQDASDKKLNIWDRGLSAAGMGGAVLFLFGKTSKVVDEAGDILTKVGKQADEVAQNHAVQEALESGGW